MKDLEMERLFRFRFGRFRDEEKNLVGVHAWTSVVIVKKKNAPLDLGVQNTQPHSNVHNYTNKN